MRTYVGGGWYLHHLTDRCVELRKDDVIYRRLIGRDGYVRVRGEPGIPREALLAKASLLAMKNDDEAAKKIAAQVAPRNVTQYHALQRRFAPAFGTPQDLEVIGRKSA
jgi:hypothetical protein